MVRRKCRLFTILNKSSAKLLASGCFPTHWAKLDKLAERKQIFIIVKLTFWVCSVTSGMATKLKPIKDKLSKTQILDQIAESTGLARKQVSAVLDSLSDVIEAHVKKNAVGEFVLPGLLKISTVRKPATKARKGINPFTKEEVTFKAKPASTAIKVRPLKKLKDMAG